MAPRLECPLEADAQALAGYVAAKRLLVTRCDTAAARAQKLAEEAQATVKRARQESCAAVTEAMHIDREAKEAQQVADAAQRRAEESHSRAVQAHASSKVASTKMGSAAVAVTGAEERAAAACAGAAESQALASSARQELSQLTAALLPLQDAFVGSAHCDGTPSAHGNDRRQAGAGAGARCWRAAAVLQPPAPGALPQAGCQTAEQQPRRQRQKAHTSASAAYVLARDVLAVTDAILTTVRIGALLFRVGASFLPR
ncbi:MAG: hypothetical protein WDW36_008683 [Sanguina aurantia]